MTTLPQTTHPVKPPSLINYDRSERLYHVYDPSSGELISSFPSGRDGKRAAFRLSVDLQSPKLHELACEWEAQYPELQSRIWKAVEIVLGKGVLPAFSMQHLAVVTSQSSMFGDYNIAMRDQMLQCDCEDFLSFAAPMIGDNAQPMCKHLIAYVLFTRLNTNTVM